MSQSGTKNPGSLIKKAAGLIAGTQKDIVGKMTVLIAGAGMTSAQIVVQLKAIVAARQAVMDAQKALSQAMATWKAQLPAATLFVGDFVAALKGQFGRRNPELLDFGIAILKAPPPRTAAEKTISANEGQKTKRARGTGLGKRQKAAITSTGKSGLQLLGPDGQPAESLTLPAPVAPAQGGPAAATAPTPAAPATGK